MSFDYHIPTKILFGAGKLNQLAEEPLPGKKALIVISNGTSMRKFGYLERLENLLKQQTVESVVYDKIQANPIKEHVMEGAAIAKENGCDFIIGLGGGSPIDAAKAIALMAVNPGDYWDYIGSGSGKGQPVENGALPVVAITTTAGTKPGMRCVKKGDWKLIKYDVLDGKVRETQLFNLAENPHEFLKEHKGLANAEPKANQVNLAGDPKYADQLKEMEALLLSEQRRLNDPFRLWDQPQD